MLVVVRVHDLDMNYSGAWNFATSPIHLPEMETTVRSRRVQTTRIKRHSSGVGRQANRGQSVSQKSSNEVRFVDEDKGQSYWRTDKYEGTSSTAHMHRRHHVEGL